LRLGVLFFGLLAGQALVAPTFQSAGRYKRGDRERNFASEQDESLRQVKSSGNQSSGGDGA
jgi:hypothetical protein